MELKTGVHIQILFNRMPKELEGSVLGLPQSRSHNNGYITKIKAKMLRTGMGIIIEGKRRGQKGKGMHKKYMIILLENIFMKLIPMYNEYTPTKIYINKIMSSKLLMEKEVSRNQDLAMI